MTEQQNDLFIWLMWVHGAILFVPVLILMAKLEWEDVTGHPWHWHVGQPAH